MLRLGFFISTQNKEDICVAFISSVIPAILQEAELLLRAEDEGFIQTGLKKDSVFKMDKIATVSKSLAIGKLGKLSPHLEIKVNAKLKKALGL